MKQHMFCVGTNGKHKENTGVAWEPMDNSRKTHVLRRILWKTQGNICFVWEPVENTSKTHMSRGPIENSMKNSGFAKEPMEM